MRIFSSMVTDTPMRPNNSIMVVTSCRCGTLRMVTGPSASSAPAMIGRVAFLAPEMRTSPSRGMPPLICSLSTERSRVRRARQFAASGELLKLFRGQGLDRKCVDLASHQGPECLVDELVPGDGPQSGELGSDHLRGEMGVVVGFDAHRGA